MSSRVAIIEEIRRIAAANGGLAPGWVSFRTETGLSESSWRGRYWARWSDALIEAGFEANQRSKAYEEKELFAAFIRVARQLGRLPTSSEYKLAARQDSTLPSFSALERLGRRDEFIQRLGDHIQGKAELSDISHLCAAHSPRISKKEASAAKRNPSDDGFVYLIKSGRFYKIGRSNAAGRREREIALQLPEATRTVHVIRTDDPVGIEAYWHARFAEKRKNGEWFDLSQMDVAAFKRRKFM